MGAGGGREKDKNNSKNFLDFAAPLLAVSEQGARLRIKLK